MKKILAFALLITVFAGNTFAQNEPIRQKSIGVSFIMNDFVTAQRIRQTSLSAVIREEKFAKFKEMNPGIAVSLFKGITPHIDFAGTIGGSFVNLPLDVKTFTQDNLLLEADATANFKMFTERSKFNLYLTAGVGASKYTSIYGAYIPLGTGMKVNVANETQVYLQLQYRVPVTPEANNYHLQASLGVSGLLGRKR